MKEKFKLLISFDWKLFLALVLLSLVPAIIQTVETFVISTHVTTAGIDVIGQIEWFDLIDETIQAFLMQKVAKSKISITLSEFKIHSKQSDFTNATVSNFKKLFELLQD